MSKCLTCKYAKPDGLCLAKGKFTVLDADACETYAPIMEHELAALRRENAKLRELARDFDKCLDTALWLANEAGYPVMPDQRLFDSLRPRMRELGVETDE